MSTKKVKSTQKEQAEELARIILRHYDGWNMRVSDVDKARVVLGLPKSTDFQEK